MCFGPGHVSRPYASIEGRVVSTLDSESVGTGSIPSGRSLNVFSVVFSFFFLLK